VSRFLFLLLLMGCPKTPWTEGRASWYGPGFKGKPTASGERFRPGKLTAAHRRLPFGTRILVEHLGNGRTVKVTINDRGPYADGRILDLSKGAARRLHMLDQGVARVQFRILGCDRSYSGSRSCAAAMASLSEANPASQVLADHRDDTTATPEAPAAMAAPTR